MLKRGAVAARAHLCLGFTSDKLKKMAQFSQTQRVREENARLSPQSINGMDGQTISFSFTHFSPWNDAHIMYSLVREGIMSLSEECASATKEKERGISFDLRGSGISSLRCVLRQADAFVPQTTSP